MRRGLLLPGVTLIDTQAMTDLMIEAALVLVKESKQDFLITRL
jgi:hypothetical protein